MAPPDGQYLRQHNMLVRPAHSGDLPVLADLYGLNRMAELLLMPWSMTQKKAFIDDQFRLQHSHFVRHFPKADFWIVTASMGDATTIGRLYVDRSTRDWQLIDILLATERRRGGLGSALITWLQRSAIGAKAEGITLQVAVNNPRAHLLYRRLLFTDVAGDDPLHQRMRWSCPSEC